jgi:hypothetical protein
MRTRTVLSMSAIVSALVLVTSGTAFAADPPGSGNPVVTHPVVPSVDFPAGDVCSFAAHVAYPDSTLTETVWYDSQGLPLHGIQTGRGHLQITNEDTGRTMEWNTVTDTRLTYPTHSSTDIVLSGHSGMAAMQPTDLPVSARHHWYLTSHGYISVELSRTATASQQQLLALRQPYQDLCVALAD